MNELQTNIFMSLLPVHLGRGYSPGESAQMAMAGIREIEAVIKAEFPPKSKPDPKGLDKG